MPIGTNDTSNIIITFILHRFIDIITLILTLTISYFFQFSKPIIATLWFILLITSWYNTNEIRTYFVKSLEDVPCCYSADCTFHNKLYTSNNNDNTNIIHNNNNNQDSTKLKTNMTMDTENNKQ